VKGTVILALVSVARLLLVPAAAQLGEATPEEAKIGRPSPNTPITDHTPPPADPRDFSGMWRNPPMPRAGGSNAGSYASAAATAANPPSPSPGPGTLAANNYRARSRYCIPGTMILSGGEAGTEILQTADELRILTEEHHNNRRIYINQQHTEPLIRSVNGDSIAHWDGDTLVIETTAFTGYGVSATLVRTERLSKTDEGRTIVDAVTYRDTSGKATPEPLTARLIWAPGTRVLEYICEEGGVAYMREDYQ
jgi:hypothetical protein